MVSATPQTPASNSVSNKMPVNPVKTAPIDTVLFNDDSLSIEIMADLIFEDIMKEYIEKTVTIEEMNHLGNSIHFK